MEQNPTVTAEEIAKKLGLRHSIIHRHLRAIKQVRKFDQWVPYKLSEDIRLQSVNVCSFLPSRLTNEPSLNEIGQALKIVDTERKNTGTPG